MRYSAIIVSVQLLLCASASARDRSELLQYSHPLFTLQYGQNHTVSTLSTLPFPVAGEATVAFDYAEDKTQLSYEGDKQTRYGFHTNGFSAANNKSIMRGSASYHRDSRQNTKWSNVVDVPMLYPYLVADSIGGTYHSETYQLSGGWATKRKAFTFGADLHYQGSVHYRKSDPRPRNTVSEFTIRPSVLFEHGTLGFAADFGYTSYKQDVRIQVEESGRTDLFYQTLGMGLYDHAFSRKANTFSSYYNGHVTDARLQLIDLRNHQYGASLAFEHTNMDNEQDGGIRIPYFTRNNTFAADGFYLFKLSKGISLAVNPSFAFAQRSGYERIYEQLKPEGSDITTWRELSVGKKHAMSSYHGSLSALLSIARGSSNYWVQLHAASSGTKETYLHPHYTRNFDALQSGLKTGLLHRIHDNWLRFEMEAAYTIRNSNLEAMASEDVLLSSMVQGNHQILSADYFRLGANASFAHPAGSFMLQYKAAASVIKAQQQQATPAVTGSISFIF